MLYMLHMPAAYISEYRVTSGLLVVYLILIVEPTPPPSQANGSNLLCSPS